MQRVVVVGAGMGGLRAAEGVRKAGFDGELVLVGAEIHMPYNRPPLSKEVLATEVEHEKVAFPLRAVLGDVDWRLGAGAVSLDLNDRAVELADGHRLGFDGLVIATGLRPRRLELPGPPPTIAAGRHAVRTLDDAAALREELQPGARVVVLGAGFIGCEVAATARQLRCEVVCAAIDPYPMVRPLGTLLGAEMQRRHEAKGVQFRLGIGITCFQGTERVTGVELADGSVLPADLVVEAISSHANTEWLANSGLDIADGVLADNALRAMTADGQAMDGVHVVGDLAKFPNPLFDDVPRRVEHWNIPTETGKRAGPALASYLRGDGYDDVLAAPFAPIPAFWSDQYEIRLQSYGALNLADDDGVEVLEGDVADEVVVGYRRGNHLVGVAGLGMLPRVNSYRAVIGQPWPGG
jgi:3-phenylpropionate/trans-cinnamate dioxygenase ferredoxin reductase component